MSTGTRLFARVPASKGIGGCIGIEEPGESQFSKIRREFLTHAYQATFVALYRCLGFSLSSLRTSLVM